MDLFVLNKTGIPLRIILIRRNKEEPDEISFVVCPRNDHATDITGERLFERVLPNVPISEELGGLYQGVTLTFVNRLMIATEAWVDGDGDGIIELKALLN